MAENERLDRIEQHLKLLKESNEVNAKALSNIQNALIGSEFNGGEGLVRRVISMDRRVEDLEEMAQENKVYIKQSKFVIGAFMLAVIGLIIEKIKS